VRDVAPKTAPSLVFTEIPAGRAQAFDAEVAAALGRLTTDNYLRMPMFTGRITALKAGRCCASGSTPRSAGPSTTTSR